MVVGRRAIPSTVLALTVAASILGLCLGPLLFALGRGRTNARSTLDGLTLGVVPTLVLLRLLPHVVEGAGILGFALFLLGYVCMWLVDRGHHRMSDRIGDAIVLPTLAVHALSDGAGLAVSVAAFGGNRTLAAGLGAALLVHRLPEGLFIASILQPLVGWAGTMARIGFLALATVVGSVVGSALLHLVPDAAFDSVVALGLGVMLRFAMHGHSPAPTTKAARAWAGAAFLSGVALVLLLPDPDSVLDASLARELSLSRCFGPLLVETAPSMLMGLMAAGLAHEFLPRKPSDWLRGRGILSQALRGVAVALPLPLRSGDVLSLSRRLSGSGVPVAAVAALAVGAAEIDIAGVPMSVRLLGFQLAVARVAAGVVVALAVALAVSWASRPAAPRSAPGLRVKASAPRHFGARLIGSDDPLSTGVGLGADDGLLTRLSRAVQDAFGPSLDHVAVWYLMGLGLAAAFEAAVDPAVLTRVPVPFDVLLSALIAVPVYVCGQGATPMAAMMVHKGMSVGAALAFVLVGPGVNVALLGVLSLAHGKRVALAFTTTLLLCSVALGVLTNLVVAARTVPEVHRLAAHEHVGSEWFFLLLLGALVVASVLRLGPRQWFANMSPKA